MYDQVNGSDGPQAETHEPGYRIDPVLARSWLLVNGAQFDKFAPAARSRADIVVLDIEDAVAPQGKAAARENVHALARRRQQRLGAGQRVRHPILGRRPGRCWPAPRSAG